MCQVGSPAIWVFHVSEGVIGKSSNASKSRPRCSVAWTRGLSREVEKCA